MCGTFGFVSRDGSPVNLDTLKRVAAVTATRGMHAWGLAWIDGHGRLKMFKQPGAITDSLGLLAIARDARVLIGRTRFATQGNPKNNLNNHPHPVDGGWFVHNGVILNYGSLIQRFNLWPVSNCDSEVLGLLIEQEEGRLIERCTSAVLSVQKSPLVFLGLWKPGRLVAVRQGNPLHLGTTKQGYFLASLADGLPGKVEEVADNEAVEFAYEGESCPPKRKSPSRRPRSSGAKGRHVEAGCLPFA
jgi:glucosamine 6-phosphate synthetase-like amidotransferase/phosphosugar isomerase protein